jgi:hypothetical protein
MTVKELIEQLNQLDPELDVYVPGYEGGFDDVNTLSRIMVCKNFYYRDDDWYYGKHEDINYVNKSAADISGYNIATGIVICK